MLWLAPENHWHKKTSKVSLTLGHLWVTLALGSLRPNPAVVGPRGSRAKSSSPRPWLQNSNPAGQSLCLPRGWVSTGRTERKPLRSVLRIVCSSFLIIAPSSPVPGGPCVVPSAAAARQALGIARGEWPWGLVPGKGASPSHPVFSQGRQGRIPNASKVCSARPSL